MILALGGLFFLWVLAIRSTVPTLRVDQANALTNLAYVQVEGIVTRHPSYNTEAGSFSFWLSDGTGELYVAAYGAEARALILQQNTPALGERVSVEGTLKVKADFVSLTLNDPRRLQITRPAATPSSIGNISAADQFQWVRVQGQVRQVHTPYPDLTLIHLRDQSGEIEIAVSSVLTLLNGPLPPLPPGRILEVVAPVSLYQDKPQLSLARPDDLTLLDEAVSIAPELTLDQVGTEHVGQWVTIRGQIQDVLPFSSGMKYLLGDDNNRQITLLLWQDLYEQLEQPGALAPDTLLQVQGQISEYRSELELIPELTVDIQILASPSPDSPTPVPTAVIVAATTPQPSSTPAPSFTPRSSPSPTPSPPPPAKPTARPTTTLHPTATTEPTLQTISLNALDTQDIGQKVTVIAQIIETASFSQGFKFTLKDGTGNITLLMWHDVYDDCWDAPQLNLGATVQATGLIGTYESELQIEPRFGGDVKVNSPGRPGTLEIPISAIPDSLGQRVTITGQVVRTEGTNSGAKIFVADDSGETLVFIWNNILMRIPDNAGLGTAGTRVRVTGVVQEYRSNLEIVPILPYDVEVLR